jgi:hypothetical protein
MFASLPAPNAPRELSPSSQAAPSGELLCSDGLNKSHAIATICLFSTLVAASTLGGPIDFWDHPFGSALII